MNETFSIEKPEKTEEIQAIIDRMPTSFGVRITLLLLIFIIALIIFGWLIKYPDIVTGNLSINANISPVKLVANTSGKLWINGFHSKDSVNAGDYIAIIQNSARLVDILKVKKAIEDFNINIVSKNNIVKFPKDVSLGELNEKYFSFINAYTQYINYYKEASLSKQEEIQYRLLADQEESLRLLTKRVSFKNENIKLEAISYARDSLLFSRKVIPAAGIEKSKMNYLTVKDSYNGLLGDITQIREEIQETIDKIQQIEIEKNEKTKQINIDLASTYTDLLDNFKAWEQKYAFISPLKGKVQFLQFWENNQPIQQGEPVFDIVPEENRMLGQMILPAFGAGKVQAGQQVIIKLENYPYTEFGSIRGQVLSISLTANSVKMNNSDIETYLVTVGLPDGLETNYGRQLRFQFEMKGTGEIITQKRRLIERLFDNLKYIKGAE